MDHAHGELLIQKLLRRTFRIPERFGHLDDGLFVASFATWAFSLGEAWVEDLDDLAPVDEGADAGDVEAVDLREEGHDVRLRQRHGDSEGGGIRVVGMGRAISTKHNLKVGQVHGLADVWHRGSGHTGTESRVGQTFAMRSLEHLCAWLGQASGDAGGLLGDGGRGCFMRRRRRSRRSGVEDGFAGVAATRKSWRRADHLGATPGGSR